MGKYYFLNLPTIPPLYGAWKSNSNVYMKNHFSEQKLPNTTAQERFGWDFVFELFENGEIIILVLLDYSEAFYGGNHELILAKCKGLGFQ